MEEKGCVEAMHGHHALTVAFIRQGQCVISEVMKKKATCDIAALVSSGMCRGPLLCWDLQ
jgi:hypothetical protein